MSVAVETPKPLPIAIRVARLRQTLVEAVTEDDVRAITARLVALAKDGDLRAIRLLLHHTLGKPVARIPDATPPAPQKESRPGPAGPAFGGKPGSVLGDPSLSDLITRQIQEERAADSKRSKPSERKPVSAPESHGGATTEAMCLVNHPQDHAAVTSAR